MAEQEEEEAASEAAFVAASGLSRIQGFISFPPQTKKETEEYFCHGGEIL